MPCRFARILAVDEPRRGGEGASWHLLGQSRYAATWFWPFMGRTPGSNGGQSVASAIRYAVSWTRRPSPFLTLCAQERAFAVWSERAADLGGLLPVSRGIEPAMVLSTGGANPQEMAVSSHEIQKIGLIRRPGPSFMCTVHAIRDGRMGASRLLGRCFSARG